MKTEKKTIRHWYAVRVIPGYWTHYRFESKGERDAFVRDCKGQADLVFAKSSTLARYYVLRWNERMLDMPGEREIAAYER